MTTDINVHLSLWYLPTEHQRVELIKDILLTLNHITLNTNTPTHLTSNQTQQPALPDITTSVDLHNYSSWKTIHSLTSNHLPLLTTISIHYNSNTACSHFPKTIKTTKRLIAHQLNNMSRILFFHKPHTTNVHETKVVKATMDANSSSSLKKNQNSFTHAYPQAYLSP